MCFTCFGKPFSLTYNYTVNSIQKDFWEALHACTQLMGDRKKLHEQFAEICEQMPQIHGVISEFKEHGNA